MKHEKMHRINLNVPQWVYVELEQVANEREWTISHLVRFILCDCVDAWEREAYEVSKDSE